MSTLTQLKCPNCGSDVNVPPGAPQATCAFCGIQFLVDWDTNQTSLIIASQQEAGKDKDRLAAERKQVYDWYMDYYNHVERLDDILTRLEYTKPTRATRAQIKELLGRRQQMIQQLEAWRQQVAQMDRIISPDISTPLPVPAPRKMRRNLSRPIGCAALVLLVAIAAFVYFQSNQKIANTATVSLANPQPPPKSGSLYFKETSHSVSAFAQAFSALGGVSGLGFPITEAFVEQDPKGGKHWVQYFEKAVIEYHPEMSGDNMFQLSRLGASRLAQKYPGNKIAPKALPGKNTYKFPETGFTVADPFLPYWHSGGELRRFGYPITPSFEERSDADGKNYIVQYFERAVMEYHPEAKPPYDVQLTALGSLRLKQVYPQGAPQHASDPVPQQ
jgi:hypothetical protein